MRRHTLDEVYVPENEPQLQLATQDSSPEAPQQLLTLQAVQALDDPNDQLRETAQEILAEQFSAIFLQGYRPEILFGGDRQAYEKALRQMAPYLQQKVLAERRRHTMEGRPSDDIAFQAWSVPQTRFAPQQVSAFTQNGAHTLDAPQHIVAAESSSLAIDHSTSGDNKYARILQNVTDELLNTYEGLNHPDHPKRLFFNDQISFLNSQQLQEVRQLLSFEADYLTANPQTIEHITESINRIDSKILHRQAIDIYNRLTPKNPQTFAELDQHTNKLMHAINHFFNHGEQTDEIEEGLYRLLLKKSKFVALDTDEQDWIAYLETTPAGTKIAAERRIEAAVLEESFAFSAGYPQQAQVNETITALGPEADFEHLSINQIHQASKILVKKADAVGLQSHEQNILAALCDTCLAMLKTEFNEKLAAAGQQRNLDQHGDRMEAIATKAGTILNKIRSTCAPDASPSPHEQTVRHMNTFLAYRRANTDNLWQNFELKITTDANNLDLEWCRHLAKVLHLKRIFTGLTEQEQQRYQFLAGIVKHLANNRIPQHADSSFERYNTASLITHHLDEELQNLGLYDSLVSQSVAADTAEYIDGEILPPDSLQIGDQIILTIGNFPQTLTVISQAHLLVNGELKVLPVIQGDFDTAGVLTEPITKGEAFQLHRVPKTPQDELEPFIFYSPVKELELQSASLN